MSFTADATPARGQGNAMSVHVLLALSAICSTREDAVPFPQRTSAPLTRAGSAAVGACKSGPHVRNPAVTGASCRGSPIIVDMRCIAQVICLRHRLQSALRSMRSELRPNMRWSGGLVIGSRPLAGALMLFRPHRASAMVAAANDSHNRRGRALSRMVMAICTASAGCKRRGH